MDPVHGALWGVLGGAVVEAYDTVAVLRETHRWPWFDPNQPSGQMSHGERWNAFGRWATAVILRVGAGGATASAVSSQISGDLAAFGLGVAGPLALERVLAMVHIDAKPAHEDGVSLGPPPVRPEQRQIIRATPSSTAVPQEASDAV